MPIVNLAEGNPTMTQDPSELKSMPLYRGTNRIYADLAASGVHSDGPLTVGDLTPFDQYHYHGTEAIDSAIAALGITAESRVLEIGSGIGGPSRYIAAATGAQVVALELQPDLNETAVDLTNRCGLSEQVEHVCVNALEYSSDDIGFDAVVSWLALFHIEQRQQLLGLCGDWLKPTGGLFVEDLYRRGDLTTSEKDDLDVILYSRYLPSRDVYEEDYRSAGFSITQSTDMSDDWRAFTADRYDSFCNARRRYEQIHGEEVIKGLNSFYGTVARLFTGGNLGGIRLVASKAGSE
jgi:cyclopropane fatty-acyl-phospholipid synthase-like methyltransferase